MLFNEPKLLKYNPPRCQTSTNASFSALQRAEIAEIRSDIERMTAPPHVSVLFNEPKLLKLEKAEAIQRLTGQVSVLFNEPKLLKWRRPRVRIRASNKSFSALQRAEIAEMQF